MSSTTRERTESNIGAEACETRLRRTAQRQGYALVKSRSRSPLAIDFGRFMISDFSTNSVVAGELNSLRAMDLDEVEAWLKEEALAV